MTALTIGSLNNGALDLEHLADFATSDKLKVTDRLGNSKLSIAGFGGEIDLILDRAERSVDEKLKGMGYMPSVPYTAGIEVVERLQTVQYLGVAYAPLLDRLPFVTGVNFDPTAWQVVQGVAGADLAAARGAGLVGVDGSTAYDAIYSGLFSRAIKLDGTRPLAITPRVPGPGNGNFSIGIVVSPASLVNSPGLFGGLAGSPQMRITATGQVRITATSIADIGLSDAALPVRANARNFIMYSRWDGTGHLSINGELAGTWPDTTVYAGDTAFIGSPDGVQAFFAGMVADAWISTQALTVADATDILNNGMSAARRAACSYAMGVASMAAPLVVGPAALTTRCTVLPLTGALAIGAQIVADTYPSRTPRSGPLYLFGDSQTFGFNASGSAVYTDTTISRLLQAYRWPDIYASAGGRSLSVQNFGVTGSGLRFIGGQPMSAVWAWQTQFYSMGQLPINWAGTCAMTNGWNDCTGAGAASDELLRVMRRAMEACTARAVINDFGGVTTAGAYRVAPQAVAGWSCTGTDEVLTSPSEGCNPFPISGSAVNAVIRKIRLAPAQYIEFTVLAVERLALFLEAFSAGAPFTISVNGDAVHTDSCATTIPDFWPMVVWLENVTPGDVVRITAGGTAGQSVIWHATGYVAAVTAAPDRAVIVCTTSGNPNNHTVNNIQRVGQQALMAARTHADMGVLFADLASSWQVGDNDGQDPDHISPQGNLRLARALGQAVPVAPVRPEWVVDLGYRQVFAGIFPTAYASLDYPNIPPGIAHDEFVFVAGAKPGKPVLIGVLAANPGLLANAWVDSLNTVTLRLTNVSAVSIDPAGTTYQLTVVNI